MNVMNGDPDTSDYLHSLQETPSAVPEISHLFSSLAAPTAGSTLLGSHCAARPVSMAV
jgi:hypothetical protein